MYFLHTILFSIYPILFLYFKNFRTVSPIELYVPLAVALSLAIFLILVFKIFYKDFNKVTLSSSIFLILFFSFGHIASFINQLPLRNFSLLSVAIFISLISLIFYIFSKFKNVNRIALYILTLLLFYAYSIDIIGKIIGVESIKISRDTILYITCTVTIVALYLLIYNLKNASSSTSLFNATAISLMAILLISSLPRIKNANVNQKGATFQNTVSNGQSEKPDIYYIILDAYGRSDILKEYYGYDNSNFIKFLENNGFSVIKDGHSNYSQTELSISSSLNMNYIQTLEGNIDKQSDDRRVLYNLIQKNEVLAFLKGKNYKFVSIASGDSNTEFFNADVYLQDKNSNLTEFRNSLFSSTPIPSLPIKSLKNIQYQLHRNKIKYAISAVGTVNFKDTPTFTFVHILAPHPPFVFKSDETEVNPKVPYSVADGSYFLKTSPKSDYIEGYKQQVGFVSKKTEEMVSRIISNSGQSTIIIIQGDHGPGSSLDQDNISNSDPKERMSILNAIRAPKIKQSTISEFSSPVNTFRLIFNNYFGTNFEILPNYSYLSSYPKPYDFHDVTDKVSRK